LEKNQLHEDNKDIKMLKKETQLVTQQQIPLVHHIIPDENPKFKYEMNLSRVVKLLTDPHVTDFVERQISALNRISKKYKNGFLMGDLVQVFKIINICADRTLENEYFVKPLCELIHIFRLPLLKEKVSDEIIYSQIMVESISQLGYLMRVPHNEVRKVLTDTLSKLYTDQTDITDLDGLKRVSKNLIEKKIEESDLSETLVKSLSLLASDPSIQVEVLKLISLLSTSAVNCQQMVKGNAAYQICRGMTSQRSAGLFVSIEILWNLFEHVENVTSSQLANVECVTTIKNKFRELMTSSASISDRQLRNDLLVITTFLAKNPKNKIVESGFAKDLILFATFKEIKSRHPLVKNLRFDQSNEDFELKKLLINILALLSKDPVSVLLFSEGKVTFALFQFLRANTNEAIRRQWTPAQYEELQLQAIFTLTQISPLLLDEYLANQGNVRLLILLEWASNQNDVYFGYGNGFYSTDCRGTKKSQLQMCLRYLRTLVSTGYHPLVQDLCDQGVISQLLQILGKYPDHDKSIDIEIQCDLFHNLSIICENDLHRKELFGTQGVEIVIDCIKRNLKKIESDCDYNRLLLASVDAIWSCIIGCFTTEDFFFEKEGLFLLLDLLEVSPRGLHNLTLGCLLELTENPKTLAHLLTWRGSNGEVTIGHLMAEMWRKEEEILGAERDSHGGVANIKHPLDGSLQRHHVVTSQPTDASSLAIVDVSENLRSKIYAVFTRLGFSDLPGLTTGDYVTLALIEKYLDLKMGEVWKEVKNELGYNGVRPITPDQEAIETIERATLERARGVAVLQRELLGAEKQQDLIDEKELYVELKGVFQQKENENARWIDHLKRTSNYRYLCASKRHQLKSIESSRSKPHFRKMETSSSHHHPTLMDGLKITVFPSRNLTVERSDEKEVI